jgi:kynurenine 3-monooxygenase
MQKIVIVGAGPAGLLLAHSLQLRGSYAIEIYERRSDPRQISAAKSRSFPLSLQRRGLKALQAIPGLEAAVAARGVWSKGSCLHRQKGQPRLVQRTTSALSIDRNQLIVALLESLLARNESETISIRFNCLCTAIDYNQQTVTFQSPTEELFTTHFDRLVGADGARSQVRQSTIENHQLHCEEKRVPDVYKTVFVRRFNPEQTLVLAANYIHVWNATQTIRLIMAPQPGDWLHGTLIFPPDQNPLEGCTTAEAVKAYFQSYCSPVGELMTTEEAEAIQQRPVSHITTVKCDRLHGGDRILLIGDAAHAVSPSLGQGCNSALQDVSIFNQCLDNARDDWTQALPEFTTQRLSDIHALRELSDYSFPHSLAMKLEFLLRITLGKQLNRWFPGFVKPLPLQLMMDTEQSYAAILEQTQGWIERVKTSRQKKK